MVLCFCDLKMRSFSPSLLLGTAIHRLKLNLNFIHLKTYLTLHWCQIHLPNYSSVYWIWIQPPCPDCIEWIHLSSWRGLLRLTLLGPNPRVSDSVGLGWAQECAFLTGSQLLLVSGPHCENRRATLQDPWRWGLCFSHRCIPKAQEQCLVRSRCAGVVTDICIYFTFLNK